MIDGLRGSRWSGLSGIALHSSATVLAWSASKETMILIATQIDIGSEAAMKPFWIHPVNTSPVSRCWIDVDWTILSSCTFTSIAIGITSQYYVATSILFTIELIWHDDTICIATLASAASLHVSYLEVNSDLVNTALDVRVYGTTSLNRRGCRWHKLWFCDHSEFYKIS